MQADSFVSTRTQKYIEALTAKTRPKKILVCLIYYPEENNTPSWANGALGALGYNRNPAKIQLILRKIFEEATRYVSFNCLAGTTSPCNAYLLDELLAPFKYQVRRSFQYLFFTH